MTLRTSARRTFRNLNSADCRAQVPRSNVPPKCTSGAAWKGKWWGQSGCKADEYQYECVFRFRGVLSKKFSPQDPSFQFTRGRRRRLSGVGLRLDSLRQCFSRRRLSATRQRQFRFAGRQALPIFGGSQRTCRRRSLCRLVRTGAADFRARNHPTGSVAVVWRSLCGGSAASG
jgi:hypothetical protein